MYNFFYKNVAKLSTIIIVLIFSTAIWQFASAGWIQGKAIIAQELLSHSWKQTVLDSKKSSFNELKQPFKTHKPWPWADTWPVARLIAPQHNIEQIVLAGDSGHSLAFGPGYSFASARPNTNGLTMISGHRDTHFNFLKDLKINQTIVLQTPGQTIRYRIYDYQIVDSKTLSLAFKRDEQTLLLVTCYPFDAITAGGSLRYLVYANKQTSKPAL